MKQSQKAGLALAAAAVLMLGAVLWEGAGTPDANAGELPAPASGYKVLAPISHGNLTIFPVVAGTTYDTRAFITLDEGLRSGEVVVAESGQVEGLRRGPRARGYSGGGAQVNRLVLLNNSDKPLILLAGEIVTGGKQDRVVGKDRIVPPQSDPIDLSVFCVEPGRWVGASAQFDAKATPMAQPSVRKEAMGDKDQQKVWDEVGRSRSAMASAVEAAPAAPSAYGGLTGGRDAADQVTATSSYARAMDAPAAKAQVDAVAAPIEHSYSSLIRELKARNAVGVVVAVNGRLIWADVFASPALLEKYWPKLVRSYAAEAVTTRAAGKAVSVEAAQDFLEQLQGTREVSESEPGVFRQTEITGPGYKVFELTSLLPKTGFEVHWAKMAE
ncbi:MAG TPA: DUF6569 family protein [Terriglobales bacterium]|nr:DUF6569 family protein [Terriglobales bacterium]